MITYLIVFGIEAALSVYISYAAINVLKQCGLYRVNYRNLNTLHPLGIVYIPIFFISQFAALFFWGSSFFYEQLLYYFPAAAIAFTGLLDDISGQKAVKGFRNHFYALGGGHITTGVVKAFMGMLAAVLASSFASYNLFVFLVNTAIVTLFINALNLFDLRPGRCIKLYILLAAILVPFSINNIIANSPLYFVSITSVILLFFDLRERGMLGDTGANLLGFTLGFYSIRLLSFNMKLPLLFVLIAIHFIAEKWSITSIIDGCRILRYIDSIGRIKNEAKQSSNPGK